MLLLLLQRPLLLLEQLTLQTFVVHLVHPTSVALGQLQLLLQREQQLLQQQRALLLRHELLLLLFCVSAVGCFRLPVPGVAALRWPPSPCLKRRTPYTPQRAPP